MTSADVPWAYGLSARHLVTARSRRCELVAEQSGKAQRRERSILCAKPLVIPYDSSEPSSRPHGPGSIAACSPGRNPSASEQLFPA